ncbi:MAG: hypothetical protein NUV44_01075 [Candidatus Scalindua sp.]|nr:hypothetical protein [Candidatus Scalindua sp.]
MSSHGLTGYVAISGTDPYKQEDAQMHPLGAFGIAENGDMYRYARKITTDLIAGNLQVSLAREGNHQNVALSAAAAIGDKLVIPTVGGTAVDANEYDEGWLVFSDVSPEGEQYKITSHEANAGTLATDVYIERGLLTVATTSSEVTLVRNPWNNPAISQLIAERPAGVSITDWDVSVAGFGWLKTRGLAAVLSDTTGVTVGYVVSISNQVNGAVGVKSDMDDEVAIGQAMQTGTAGEFNPVWLSID